LGQTTTGGIGRVSELPIGQVADFAGALRCVPAACVSLTCVLVRMSVVAGWRYSGFHKMHPGGES